MLFLGQARSLFGAAAPAPEKTKPPLDTSTRLAYDRTIMACERTLMAWIRTAASLISFGFSIYKFFQLERGMGAKFGAPQAIGPRRFAMIMIATGIIGLAIATIQHHRQVRAIKSAYENVPWSTAGLVAGLVSFLGLLAIFAVIFRL